MDPLAKADDALRAALEESTGTLRVILSLEPAGLARPEAEPPVFASRREMREALIERSTAAAAAAYGPILSSLRALGLDVSGGKLTSVVVARGAPEQIRNALELDGVKAGSLDSSAGLGVRFG